MEQIRLRKLAGLDSPDDIIVSVQERTYDYLLSSSASEIRVSAYIEVDLPRVETTYAELFVQEDCPYRSLIQQVIPGSRARDVQLPCEMKAGEQLVLLVQRSPKEISDSI
jgi:hypothetical protein